MVGLSLVGCVNNDTLSGMFIPLLKRNKYRMSAMAPSLTYIRYRFRAVMIPTLSVQLAVLFLVVSWEFGGGTGRSLATAAGAVAGGNWSGAVQVQ